MRRFLFVFFACTAPLILQAQWNSNTAGNNAVSNNSSYAEDGAIAITDGSNGAILLFADYSLNAGLYAQKISSAGTITWGSSTSPVLVNSSPNVYEHAAIPDGSGGAFFAWTDYGFNNGEIFVQHINAAGSILWGTNGVRVTNTANYNTYPRLCSDGSGGLIVAWSWDNGVSSLQVSAQRYNSAGTALWTANGVQASLAAGFRADIYPVADGSNGVILFFLDTRNDNQGTNYNYVSNNELDNIDIYAQRLNGTGARLWTDNGTAICTAAKNQGGFDVSGAISDGSGGAIFAFLDERNDPGNFTNYDIYAQRVNGTGVVQWLANGLAVTTAAGNQYPESMVSDGAGGFAGTFFNEIDQRFYSQRVLGAGSISWTAGGVAVTPAGLSVDYAEMAPDGLGNFISVFSSAALDLVKAQKQNATGALLWDPAGVIVCNASGSVPSVPQVVTSDAGSVITSWTDSRNISSMTDLYASRILTNGSLAGQPFYISAADGNWNSPATWLGGVVPPAGAAVTVRHNVVVTVAASCYSLLVEQPAGFITVKTGVNFTVTH